METWTCQRTDSPATGASSRLLVARRSAEPVIGDETESFALPPQCTDLIFADSFGFGTSRWSSVSP